jgi:chromosome segregation ATPase
MKEDSDKPKIKEEARALRKKVKRVEDSRSSIKIKSREKGKTIKAHQDRQKELEQNRDDWKAKCKTQEKERIDIDDKYKKVAALLEMKEEELRTIMEEFDELKKKYPPTTHRG